MKKILVATDYSDNADNAVDFAIDLANHHGALVSLVSAVEEPYSAAAGALVSIKDEIRDEAMETMGKTADRVRGRLKNGATLDTHTVDGEVGPTISRVAKSKGYDLIVMGTKGSTAAKELFTGSVANAMIKNSEVPVLAVPVGASFAPFQRILIADDRKGNDVTRTGLLRQIVDDYGSTVTPFHAEGDEVAKEIKQAVHQSNADLLVMVYHDHGFFGNLFQKSTVSKVVFDVDRPLLVFRG